MTNPIVEIDIHGLNRYQAKTKLDSVIKKSSRGVYRIRVIHGYHGGTELKDMVKYEYGKNPLVKRVAPGSNEGITELILKEYF